MTKIENRETVDLQASGYEWTCPNCEHGNNEAGVNPTVTCGYCGEFFPVGEIEHAGI